MSPKPSKKPVSNERIGEIVRWMVANRQKSYTEDNPITGITITDEWVYVTQTLGKGIGFKTLDQLVRYLEVLKADTQEWAQSVGRGMK